MNINIYSCLATLLLLTSCYKQADNNNVNKHTLFVQGLAESKSLTTIIEVISNHIDDIIKEEMGLDKTFDFKFFIPKPVFRLTVYYIYDVINENDTRILATLDTIAFNEINSVFVSPRVEFFSGPFGENDELVIIIDDVDQELLRINQSIKTAMHQANDAYQQSHKGHLYDREKSEQFSYLPHIGLGRIRSTSIKQHLEDPAQFTSIFERIQLRVKDYVDNVVGRIIFSKNSPLIIEKIGIFDLEKREYIKEYSLEIYSKHEQVRQNAE